MMKKIAIISVFAAFCATGCLMDEVCEEEAQSIRMGNIYIDMYEASRTNATVDTQGTGLTMACNYAHSIPWTSVTYEDARNACLDAGKRLCTKAEWLAACGSVYPYGSSHQTGTCNDASSNDGETIPTGNKAGCKSATGAFDMSGNAREWVEEGELMGGSFNSESDESRCTNSLKPSDAMYYSPSQGDGFRCCQDVMPIQ